MAAQLIHVADDVRTLLAAGSFSQAISPLRELLNREQLSALTTVAVQVVPATVLITRAARPASTVKDRRYGAEIWVQKKLNGTDAEIETEAAGLLLLVEEMIDYLFDNVLATSGRYPETIENDPAFSAEAYYQERLFESVVTATYRHFR